MSDTWQSIEEAFTDLWPELTDEERDEFLWACTAFPVGDNARERLEYFITKCGKDLDAVFRLNEIEFNAAFAEVGS